MPAYGEHRRTLEKVSLEVGHKGTRQVRGWSAKYNWVQRVAAYDAHLGHKIVAVKEATFEQYTKKLIEGTSLQLIVLDEAIEKKLKKVVDNLDDDKHVKSIDILNLVTAIEKSDNLKRRLAGLPIEFKKRVTEGEEEDFEQITYLMGAD